jgi:hypothetical protein
MTGAGAMEAGVVNVLLTIDPVASHAAGRYLTWDGRALDGEETARCDAATPHELWAWVLTAGEPGGDGGGPRADVRRLTGIVAGTPGGCAALFSEAVLAALAAAPAREILAGLDRDGRPYPVTFRAAVLPSAFRDTVLPALDGALRAEALEILDRLEAGGAAGGAG